MKDYKVNGKVIEITLDNDKVVKVMTEYIDKCVKNLEIDQEEAVLMWLEDEGYIENLDQTELCDQAKENKSNKIVGAKKETDATKKTQKERVKKENPDKEYLVGAVAEFLGNIVDISNIIIENKAKLITFTYKDNEYKFDLVQKRKTKV